MESAHQNTSKWASLFLLTPTDRATSDPCLQYNGEKASLHERSLKKASKMLKKNSLLGHMNSIVSLAPCRRFITGSWVNNTITMVSQQQKTNHPFCCRNHGFLAFFSTPECSHRQHPRCACHSGKKNSTRPGGCACDKSN